MSRKPRPEAKLKNLPPAKQAKLVEILRAHSYRAAVPLVKKEFKLATSPTALCEFFKWYPIARNLETAQAAAKDLFKQLKDHPGLVTDADKLSELTLISFEAKAAQEGDLGAYLGLRKSRLKEREIKTAERRIALIEKKAKQLDELEELANNPNLTPDEMAVEMRARFGLK